MGPQGPPRVFRLSESAPPANFDALNQELDNSSEPKEPLPQTAKIMGIVKEKGFSTQPVALERISVPQARVTAFPLARHRAEGPHWGPPSAPPPLEQRNGDDEGGARSAAIKAEPLRRRRDTDRSLWRSNRKSERSVSVQTQNILDDTRQVANPPEASTTGDKSNQFPEGVGIPLQDKRTPSELEVNRKDNCIQKPTLGVSESSKLEKEPGSEIARGSVATGNARLLGNLERQTPSSVEMQRKATALEDRTELGEHLGLAQSHQTEKDIDAENRGVVLAMSSQEVANAQAELSQKLRPELLEILRKRGAEKERKRLAERVRASSNPPGGASSLGIKEEVSPAELHPNNPVVREGDKAPTKSEKVTVPSVQTVSKPLETQRGTKIGPADLLTAGVAAEEEDTLKESTPPPTTDPWTLRVEAVRSMRFDLDGTFVSLQPAPQKDFQFNSAGGTAVNSQDNILSVVERDYLRTEGDPVGSGYLLKEALALVRSTVAGQRAVALRLIASVLENAFHSLQYQTSNASFDLNHEGIGGSVDWQAIWAYALGPEADLVLTLRLALDDGHSTVVANCCRAIQALLSYSANESYFDSLEACWPGDSVVYTAPIFRRKTKPNEGFIGGGHWKYNVKAREMFPFAGASAQEKVEEDGKDTVADDGHISNKDVAAGLIRMGVLPRIRYILEVDKLIAAEEALLSILICMARHSPTAANAVMKCPRLIDAVLDRFIGNYGSFPGETWSARLKAIRLLKVLSQAKRTNCIYFEETGAIQAVMRPLFRQGLAEKLLSGDTPDKEEGFYEVMTETVRFWRVCIDYGVGISLFSDCYSTLCFWLHPLSKEEILTVAKEEALLLARESYFLLEHIARSLPVLHSKPDQFGEAEPSGVMNWSWGVATAMLNTSIKWLSPECTAGVHLLLEQFPSACEKQLQEALVPKSRTRNVLGIVAAVLHFLATVCERVASEDELNRALDNPSMFGLPWLPTFVPQLGLALAGSGLLRCSQVDTQSESAVCTLGEKKHTLLECLSVCKAQADHDSALVAINSLSALVRVSCTVDKIICSAKPTGLPPPENQTHAHRILKSGLLSSANKEIRILLDLCKENVVSGSHLMQMSSRGGPAPGLGIGWGSLYGGAWSKEVMIAQASARLAMDLIPILSRSLSERDSLSKAEKAALGGGEPPEESHHWTDPASGDPTWRFDFGLAIISTSTPLSKELVLRVCSSVIFHPSTLSALVQKVDDALVSWRSKRGHANGSQSESHVADDEILHPDCLSKVLLRHCEEFWLAAKYRKNQDEMGSSGFSDVSKTSLGSRLPTLKEVSVENSTMRPESLMHEWVGQRLPLPSHWFLSPMVIDLSQASKTDWENGLDSKSEQTAQLEEVLKAGLAFFLGFEVLGANVSEAALIRRAVPLVRKIHSLSTIFVSGGDSFLDQIVQDLIGALQNLVGDQVGEDSNNSPHHRADIIPSREDVQSQLENGASGHGYPTINSGRNFATPENYDTSEPIFPLLDFEGCIDPSYLNYVEIIANQFVASSYGDLVFGRQIGLHFWLDVPVMLRLAIWRVLTDARVLELLPPLSECCGHPQRYLYPLEANEQMLESFVSAWSSGALDKAAKRSSLSFTLAIHHLGGFIFGKTESEEILLVKRKMIRTLVRCSVGNRPRQDMIARWVNYGSSSPCPTSEVDPKERNQLRYIFLCDACQGDTKLTRCVGESC